MANEHRWSDHGRGWSGDRGRHAGESRGSQGDAWRDDMTDDERGWRGSEAGREGYGQDYRSEPGGGYGREPRREGYGREGYGREGYGPEGYGRAAMRREGYGGGYGGQEGYRAGGYGGGGGYGEGPERYGRQGYGRPGGQGRQGGAYGGEHGGSRYGEVTVAKCEVTLNGTVDSRADKRRAEDVAEHVSGVSHVQNNLRVRQGAGSQWTGGAAGTVPSAGASGTTASTVRSTAASPGATGASGGSGMGGPSSSTPGGETPQRH